MQKIVSCHLTSHQLLPSEKAKQTIVMKAMHTFSQHADMVTRYSHSHQRKRFHSSCNILQLFYSNNAMPSGQYKLMFITTVTSIYIYFYPFYTIKLVYKRTAELGKAINNAKCNAQQKTNCPFPFSSMQDNFAM